MTVADHNAIAACPPMIFTRVMILPVIVLDRFKQDHKQLVNEIAGCIDNS